MVTLALIGINVVVSLIAFSAFKKGDRPERFLFTPYDAARGGNFPGIILSHFSHSDMGHLFFNMFTLYFFAPVVGTLVGQEYLLLIYLLAGVGSTLVVMFYQSANPLYRALGASGSVSGVLFAAIVVYPDMNVFFFLVPVPIPAPIFAVGYIALSMYLMKKQVGNISHEAHIGGALTGFLVAGVIAEKGYQPLLDRLINMVS